MRMIITCSVVCTCFAILSVSHLCVPLVSCVFHIYVFHWRRRHHGECVHRAAIAPKDCVHRAAIAPRAALHRDQKTTCLEISPLASMDARGRGAASDVRPS